MKNVQWLTLKEICVFSIYIGRLSRLIDMMGCSLFKLQQCNNSADVEFGIEFQRTNATKKKKMRMHVHCNIVTTL